MRALQPDGGCYDPETIELLRAVLNEAWDSLSPAQQGMTGKANLASRILKLAAEGERDPTRLRTAALIEMVAPTR